MIPGFSKESGLYKKLLVADVRAQLPGTPLEPVEALTDSDLRTLLITASGLALSEDSDEKTLAYEIATRIIELLNPPDPEILATADLILSRLGNFPGCSLLISRHDFSREIPAYLKLEALTRDAENRIPDFDRPLTDFQFELYESLRTERSTSVSAPTSAGKSFTLALDALRRFRSGEPTSIVYVVPTRALIRQMMLRIIEELNKSNLRDTAVRCVPLPISPQDATAGVVYVLTQERLHSLLNTDEGEPWITALIIDEAQGVKDGSRGILLQSAIDATLFRFPNIPILFASPLAKNPEVLLGLFGRQQGRSFVERHSPVSQNRILVQTSHRQATRFSLLNDEEELDLGLWRTGLRMSGGIAARKAHLSRLITQPGDCTIIYEGGPASAENTALELLRLSNATPQEADTDDPEILEFIDFLHNNIHARYPLAKVLKRGIAFHFGEMPPIVRSRVEDLFSENRLRFLACTSTLLQGVNLPAKNIVIDRPTKGQGQPMEKADFENLAGRAGRLLKEFHGNVWCIKPNDWGESNCLHGEKLQEISSAFIEIFKDGGSSISRLLRNDRFGSEKEKEFAVAALGKLYSEFIARGRPIEESPIWDPQFAEQLSEISRSCRNIRRRLPPAVFSRNSTTSPITLESLLDYFHRQSSLSDLVPLPFNNRNAYPRMEEIFRVIWQQIEGKENRSYRYHTWLGWSWITDTSLRQMIEEKIRRERDSEANEGVDEDELVSKSIRRLMKELEQIIRFRYVKGLKAYTDVLRFALLEAGERELSDNLIPLHLFLECGASDSAALGLISIGLSRTTALLLRNQIRFPDNATPETCRAILLATDINTLRIPPLCRREIDEVLAR